MVWDKRIAPEELHQPGMRRILEAMRAIEKERPGLLEDAAFAATELARNPGDGGRTLE